MAEMFLVEWGLSGLFKLLDATIEAYKRNDNARTLVGDLEELKQDAEQIVEELKFALDNSDNQASNEAFNGTVRALKEMNKTLNDLSKSRTLWDQAWNEIHPLRNSSKTELNLAKQKVLKCHISLLHKAQYLSLQLQKRTKQEVNKLQKELDEVAEFIQNEKTHGDYEFMMDVLKKYIDVLEQQQMPKEEEYGGEESEDSYSDAEVEENDSHERVQGYSNEKQCVAILKTGKNQGNRCPHPAKYGDYCGKHTSNDRKNVSKVNPQSRKCVAVLKSGQNKGRRCAHPVKYGDYCGRHKGGGSVPQYSRIPAQPSRRCPAILKSGQRKGEVCGRPPKHGIYCGYHK